VVQLNTKIEALSSNLNELHRKFDVIASFLMNQAAHPSPISTSVTPSTVTPSASEISTRSSISPWMNLQFENSISMQEQKNSEESPPNREVHETENLVRSISWPADWIFLKKKTLQDAFFNYYVLNMPKLYCDFDRAGYTKKERDSIKNSWMVIQNAVKFMKYFVDEIPAPPASRSAVQVSQWKATIARIADEAQKQTVTYLSGIGAKIRSGVSLSGNERVMRQAPPPPNRQKGVDFFDRENISGSPSPPPAMSLEQQLNSAMERGVESAE
jgi:hypothetical protein